RADRLNQFARITMLTVLVRQRWLATVFTAGVIGAAVFIAGCDRNPTPKPPAASTPAPVTVKAPTDVPAIPIAAPKDVPQTAKPDEWTMFGGDATRNMVNLRAKNLP